MKPGIKHTYYEVPRTAAVASLLSRYEIQPAIGPLHDTFAFHDAYITIHRHIRKLIYTLTRRRPFNRQLIQLGGVSQS